VQIVYHISGRGINMTERLTC